MNKSLKDGEIEELKNKAEIFSIISGYVNLKKTGKNFTGLCPFHKEKTPSFIVDNIKQLYHCFGCGAGGDVVSFIMKVENISFIEALEFLSKKIGYELKFNYSDISHKPDKKNKLLELNDLAKKYFNYILFNSSASEQARNYLFKRGFSKETLDKFEVGYSLDKWDNFCVFAKKRGFSNSELIDSGLAIESSRNKNGSYDRFRARIMFPIKDLIGRTIGFGGRITDIKSITAGNNMKTAKYINTPETKIYTKSKNIYGLYDAKNQIVNEDRALIVEGYTDVNLLYQYGIKNAVASLGTALTSEQVRLLARFTKNIILVFDSDIAGLGASIKGFEKLKEYNENIDLFNENNINIKVCILEKDYDPADFILNKGSKEFNLKLDQAVNIIDFNIDFIIKKYDLKDLSSKISALNELLDFIMDLESRIVQEECIKKISVRLDIKEDLILEELQRKSSKPNKKFKINLNLNDGKSSMPKSNLKKIEIEALYLIIQGSDTMIENIEKINEEYFRFADTKKLFLIIRETIRSLKKNKKEINFPVEISSDKLIDEQIKILYNNIFFNTKTYSDEKGSSTEVLLNLKKLFIADKITLLKKEMLDIELKIKKETSIEKKDSLKKIYDDIYNQVIELEVNKLKIILF